MKLEDFVPVDDLTEAGYQRFLENRGGCRCCVSPPCFACTDPPTQEEFERYEDGE